MSGGSRDGPIRIVIADDQAIVRAGLHMLLESEPGFEVVAEAADIATAVQLLEELEPDVLVVDSNVPGELGIDAIPQLDLASSGTAIVVLTVKNDPDAAREALRAGARGYVLKHSPGIELTEAIRTAVAGETYLNPSLGARLATEPDPAPGALTDRELGILKLIAFGHTNSEIAQQLYLSVRTVESHRAHIQQKLRLSTRAELVRYALERGLLER